MMKYILILVITIVLAYTSFAAQGDRSKVFPIFPYYSTSKLPHQSKAKYGEPCYPGSMAFAIQDKFDTKATGKAFQRAQLMTCMTSSKAPNRRFWIRQVFNSMSSTGQGTL